jgi:hypothetical protein
MRTLITGPVGSGKSTLAASIATETGLPLFLCTDTPSQAVRRVEGALYAPENLSKDWSALSQWVGDNWIPKPGPWIIEGVAVPRALRKWHEAHPESPIPCERFIVLRGARLDLNPRQRAMSQTLISKTMKLTASWPELASVTEWR